MEVGLNRVAPTSLGPKDRFDALAARPEVVPSQLPAIRASTGAGLTRFKRVLANRQIIASPRPDELASQTQSPMCNSWGRASELLSPRGSARRLIYSYAR